MLKNEARRQTLNNEIYRPRTLLLYLKRLVRLYEFFCQLDYLAIFWTSYLYSFTSLLIARHFKSIFQNNPM